jgi:phospholipid/cholesterol/gamma-HCH transport system permease protein
MTDARFTYTGQGQHQQLSLAGDWALGKAPGAEQLCAALPPDTHELVLVLDQLGHWDSSLASALLALIRHCQTHNIQLDTSAAPPGLQKLLKLAAEIPAADTAKTEKPGKIADLLMEQIEGLGREWRATLVFIGDTWLALARWLRGKANTRPTDIAFFIHQAGPRALPIITLISTSVGMILAYLGSVQLRQLGAQVYVANLVSLGMVREMGALMTAIIVAGRTGAAYAAQLGTMQANEEVDALKTMGISSMEFLVVPRLVALVFVMPLLSIYANVIGMAGGALVASGMDVNFKQYILQTQGAVGWGDMFTGLFKSLVFGVLIAIAGCQAGLSGGRSSNAVGVATTNAVVRAIVYLILADAAFNILYDKLGI